MDDRTLRIVHVAPAAAAWSTIAGAREDDIRRGFNRHHCGIASSVRFPTDVEHFVLRHRVAALKQFFNHFCPPSAVRRVTKG
jgi:hypothetical protein